MEWSGVEWKQTWPVAGEPPRSGCTASPLPSQGLRKHHRPSGEVQFAKTAPDPGGPGEQAGGAEQQAAPRGRGGRKGRERREGETGRRWERRTQTDPSLREEQVDARRAAAPAAATFIQTANKPKNTQTAQSDPATKTQASAERPTSQATLRRLRKPVEIRPHREDTSERREADVPSHASIMQSEPTGKTQANAEKPTCPATPAPRA